jgi:hypothetical protein
VEKRLDKPVLGRFWTKNDQFGSPKKRKKIKEKPVCLDKKLTKKPVI